MNQAILRVRPLGFPWETTDPFLFCVHHDDAYPAGNAQLGPAVSLSGRNLGQDFQVKDGFRMYHGQVVPGFPQHPHRGFETVTVVRRGYIDHSDSLGATARFGQGDTQWLTAGAGIVHSEMFPLLREDAPNPLELFQIWLNLPSDDKLAPPHFAMLWNEQIPVVEQAGVRISVIAGELQGQRPPAPPPHSWAARPDSGVAIWTIQLAAGASWQLPAAAPGVQRTLYFYRGSQLQVAGDPLAPLHAVELADSVPVSVQAGPEACELLLLAGKPIAEPVVQYGPFVMNTRDQIQQAFSDYQRTGFGGWPWPSDDPVHAKDAGRFARHADGKVESAGK
jgi:redox-sensitive bicupin YhaK (pirin superfamily)